MLTQDTAKSLFFVQDGVLMWRHNGKKAGGTNGKLQPYIRVCVDRVRYMAHKVVYLIHNGFMPQIVDHIDGNLQNNCIENLREATRSENAINKKIRKDSVTGIKNVTQDKTTGRYKVHLTINGKRKHFGTYDDLELADLVAMEAQSKFYGAFASYQLKGA